MDLFCFQFPNVSTDWEYHTKEIRHQNFLNNDYENWKLSLYFAEYERIIPDKDPLTNIGTSIHVYMFSVVLVVQKLWFNFIKTQEKTQKWLTDQSSNMLYIFIYIHIVVLVIQKLWFSFINTREKKQKWLT